MTDSQETLTELEFRVTDEQYPVVDGSEAASCRCILRELLPRSDDGYVEFFEVRDGDPATLETAVSEREVADARVVADRENQGIVEVRVTDSDHAVVPTLADEGAFLQEFRVFDGEGRLVAAVPHETAAGTVVETVTGEHPSVDLVAKRDQPPDGPLFVRERVQNVVSERLTERQQEVLVAAFVGGYFERPRETTGADLADRLDITPATFSQHLRAAQRKVLSALLEDGFGTARSGFEVDIGFD
mgnify:CR=1 FL=1